MLTGHFAAPQNVMLRRIVFRQRWQQAGESVHHYVAIILMLHAPLQAVVSLEDLRLASEEDPHALPAPHLHPGGMACEVPGGAGVFSSGQGRADLLERSMASRTTNASSWWPTTSIRNGQRWSPRVRNGSGAPFGSATGPGGRHANSRTVPERQAQRRMKQRLDTRRRVRAPLFTVGDWVRIHRPNRDHKLLSFWTLQDTWKTIL
ncbi:hypothetical protein F7725_012110 [Dissostichus mawsoni]|uniref:Uncharacterized protein n=1 Tax=Dissostichus mawsoni TaxID=36200 RepID=A0A7J5ZD00_DISMA|nr:hypothetical protein F7725_012110 [Dissostichus mawsoni]